MDILPIESIRDEDAPIVGGEIVNLARLLRLSFDVASGVVVCPPEIELNTVLKHFNLGEKEVFEQSLTLVRKEILKITPPEELVKVFARRKIDPKKLWIQLLEIWLNEVRTRVWREGFKEGATLGLSAQSVFFTQNISSSGQAFFDPDQERVEIKVEKGEIDFKIKDQIAEIVEKGNKKLFLPQIYFWIVEKGSKKVQLVKLLPFTHTPSILKPTPSSKPSIPKDESRTKSAVKVFLDLSGGLVTNPEVDGVLICGEKTEDFESLVFRIVESAVSFEGKDVIFKLSDKIENLGGVRGSLRLIHQDSLLRSEVEAFLFARNQKRLLNVQIGVPFVRSVNEFLEMKRTLATLGVTRKGSMKLWLELAVPENIINLDEYIVAGLDGVILNLDELSSWLGGFDDDLPESNFYQKQVKALIKFLEDGLKLLHKSGVPILASGNLALHDDVLEFLVGKGIKGVIADLPTSHSLHDHLRFVEKRIIRSKLA